MNITSVIYYENNMKKMIFVIIIVFDLCAGILHAQLTYTTDQIHKQYGLAFSVLRQSGNTLPGDSIYFRNEYNKLLTAYKNMSDQMKLLSDSAIYANFEVQRFTTLCYNSNNILGIERYYDSLLFLSSNYYDYIEQNAALSNEITKCYINSMETTGIDKDSILKHVKATICRHMEIVYPDCTDTILFRKLIDRYAAQYYSRGIISMAEPLFRKFKLHYQTDRMRMKVLRFSQNYMLYNKYIIPQGTLGERKGDKIFVFNQVKNNFDIVYLISLIRLANIVYPSVDFIIARDIAVLCDKLIEGIGKNLACNFLFMDLDSTDIEYYRDADSYVFAIACDSIKFTTNNAIEMLETLETPIAEQKVVQKLERKKLMHEIHEKREIAKNQPPDTCTKYQIQIGETDLNLKGNWSGVTGADIYDWHFTTRQDQDTFNNYGVNQINIYEGNNVIFNQPIICTEFNSFSDTIGIIANHNYDTRINFENDTINRIFYGCLEQQLQLFLCIQQYESIITDYPFPESEFIKSIKQRQELYHTQIQNLIDDINNNCEVKYLVNVAYHLNMLKTAKPKADIEYRDFTHYMSTDYFDTIVYSSPYYKQMIDAWIEFGIKDPFDAIDFLFSSQEWIPDKAVAEVGNYIGERLNTLHRNDLSLYIDTMYLEEKPKVLINE